MTWTRVSDTHFDQPVILRLSRSAVLLDIEATVWSNRTLTNGLVPKLAIGRLSGSTDLDADVSELLKVGRWEEVGEDYQLDWSDQEPAERVRERLAFSAERQRRFRDRVDRHARGDHTVCDPKFCNASSNASGNGSHDALRAQKGFSNALCEASVTPPVTATPSYPIRSDPKDLGTRVREPSAAEPLARRAAHQWEDDGSGISCDVCGMPKSNGSHDLTFIEAAS